jgi:hypothetical protein
VATSFFSCTPPADLADELGWLQLSAVKYGRFPPLPALRDLSVGLLASSRHRAGPASQRLCLREPRSLVTRCSRSRARRWPAPATRTAPRRLLSRRHGLPASRVLVRAAGRSRPLCACAGLLGASEAGVRRGPATVACCRRANCGARSRGCGAGSTPCAARACFAHFHCGSLHHPLCCCTVTNWSLTELCWVHLMRGSPHVCPGQRRGHGAARPVGATPRQQRSMGQRRG